MWLVRNGDSLTLVWQKLRTYSVAASVFLSKNKIFDIVCASPKSMPQRWWNLKNTFSFNIEETGKSVKPKKLGKKKIQKVRVSVIASIVAWPLFGIGNGKNAIPDEKLLAS